MYQKNSTGIICEYRTINRIDDFKYSTGKWLILKNEQLILDEVFEVNCKLVNTSIKTVYNNLFVQIVPKINKSKINITKCKSMNVILLSYDSVSRPSWLQRTPKTSNFIFDIMNFTLLKGYNIIGDGTPGKIISLI